MSRYPDWGILWSRQKKARKGRNPQTGEEIEIAPRRVLNFKLSQVLKDEINYNNDNGA